MKQSKFSAKILLFGEHTILRGSKALAMPFQEKKCYWSWKEYHKDSSLDSFADFLKTTLPDAFDIKDFKLEIYQGLCLYSEIPNGYGLGSSGAVCVAIFHRFATQYGHKLLRENPKAFFGQMEAFFHGSSSGTDPLIIYLEQNLCLLPDGDYKKVNLKPLTNGFQFFLLDTKQQRKTAPLVARFIQKYDTEEEFKKNVDENWAKPTNEAIDALMDNDMNQLWFFFEKISSFQLNHLSEWVLPSLNPIWENGLLNQNYLLKICGAGGGGYCLGLTKNWIKTQKELEDYPLIPFEIV